MLRPESFDLALARDVFFAVMTAGARRERDANGGAEGDRDVARSAAGSAREENILPRKGRRGRERECRRFDEPSRVLG
jgi:hypothetical protein